MQIDLIDINSIEFQNYESTDRQKFANWPIDFIESDYHRNRLEDFQPSNLLFFGAFENNKIVAILEFHFNNYDTNLWGFKCGAISNIFFSKLIEKHQKEKALNLLFGYFQAYRKKENIRFVIISIDNWEKDLSLIAQEQSFKYILTWGSCFFNTINTELFLPEGFSITTTKNDMWLDSYLAMVEYYFKGGRFYMDGHFENSKVDKMYKDLISNSFKNPNFEFITLLNSSNEPVCFTISKDEQIDFGDKFKFSALRFLLADKKRLKKNVATPFFNEVSKLLYQKSKFLTSGIEMHNLPSLSIHNKCGYKFNYIYSAYHSFI